MQRFGGTDWWRRNKADGERQILYDFIHMWNLKKNTTKQTKQKQAHRYRIRLVVARAEVGWGWEKWVTGVNCMVMDGN